MSDPYQPNFFGYKTQVRAWIKYWLKRCVGVRGMYPTLAFKMRHVVSDPDEIVREIRLDDELTIQPPKEQE